jgi:outer membrane cobalamin receptor
MSQSYRRHLLTGSLLASFAIVSQPAFAQQSPDEQREAQDVQIAPSTAVEDSQVEPGDEIVVTGSLIRNPNIEASAPVTTVGEAEIELQQVNVAEELLREIPGVVPSIGSQVNNGNGGASFVDLRGLGTNRNLVLLDGRRIVPANTGGAVDLNTSRSPCLSGLTF